MNTEPQPESNKEVPYLVPFPREFESEITALLKMDTNEIRHDIDKWLGLTPHQQVLFLMFYPPKADDTTFYVELYDYFLGRGNPLKRLLIHASHQGWRMGMDDANKIHNGDLDEDLPF